MRNSGIELKM
uniref:Uncharacterized protein n=1 Tax=Rhizophora mucronata TaxID=61149 RepID=A0A2P2PBM8_RHIMU